MTTPLTPAEKLTLALLCDLGRPAAKRELDYEFIAGAVRDNDLWALDWRYPGLELGVDTPTTVRQVCNILDMWSNIERSFKTLGSADQKRVTGSEDVIGAPYFYGFSGNDETEFLHVGRRLVEDLGRWGEFVDRDMNSHFPSVEMHLRLLEKYIPLWERKIKSSGAHYLSADEIIDIVREQVHPEHRIYKADGSWEHKAKID